MTNADRQRAMREFLLALTGDPDMWTLLGRALYRRGQKGTFKLEVWSGGTFGGIAGLVGTFAPSNGGPVDRIEFRFEDLLVSTNPTKNPNYRGEACHANETEWDWHIAKPASLRPLGEAIDEWILMLDLTSEDLADMARDAETARKRTRRSR